MAMTAAVKDELSRLTITKPCCRKAEVSSLLRFAGGLHIASGKVVIEVELDTSQSARRLKKDIADIYGHDSDLAVLSSSGLRKGSRYVVRVIESGEALARQTGLIDANGRPIRGLPPQVVAANVWKLPAQVQKLLLLSSERPVASTSLLRLVKFVAWIA
jgi:DNA-binding protein WhiA